MTSAILAPADDALLAAIVESSDDAIVAKDLDGTVFAWNGAAERLFGYTAADMIGQPITTIFPPGRVAEEVEFLARIASGERVEHYETLRQRKDGQVISVSVTISPIRDKSGQVVGASKILRDLTERNARSQRIRQLQSELAHVQRLNELGQMVSALVHEVNQPLTAIGNYAAAGQRLLVMDEPEKLRTALDQIGTQTARTRDIVKRIANFVRRREFAMQDEDLGVVIDEAVSLTRTFVKDSGLGLSVAMDPGGMRVLIDKIQVQQVIFNLVRNSIEAMQHQAHRGLAIGARRGPADMVEISVADTGPGLADDVRGRLFQPFVTTKDHGMGVGLSVCRSIVEAHAGRLWAEDNPGGGTVFRFTVRDASKAESASF